jgi:hypothetical protein
MLEEMFGEMEDKIGKNRYTKITKKTQIKSKKKKSDRTDLKN